MSLSDQTGKTTIVLSQMGPFEHLFRQHYTYVCNIIHKYVRDKSKVEDIAQELFSELWIKRDSIQIHTSLAAYLRRMAISRSLNYLRDTRKHNWDDLELAVDSLQDPMYQSPEAIMALEMAELKGRIDQAVESLPEKCRIVFLLSRNDELSYAEISQQLGISAKTVENQIGKALKLLRLALQDYRG